MGRGMDCMNDNGILLFWTSWRSQLGVLSPSPPKTNDYNWFFHLELVYHQNPQTASKFNE
jgi:hypothetical protein